MIATLWLADLGIVGGLRFKAPKASTVDGLRFSAGGVASKLRRGFTPRLIPRRAAWFAVWDDEAALDRFVADRPSMVSTFADGCRLRLELNRVIQRNAPGFEEHWVDRCEPTGPVLVVTVNRPKLMRLPRFLMAAVPAEKAAAERDDLQWAMGFSRPPGMFATVTLWDSAAAAADYAYGQQKPQHRAAIQAEAG